MRDREKKNLPPTLLSPPLSAGGEGCRAKRDGERQNSFS